MAINTEKNNEKNVAEREFKMRYVFAFVLSVLFMLSIVSYSPEDLTIFGFSIILYIVLMLLMHIIKSS